MITIMSYLREKFHTVFNWTDKKAKTDTRYLAKGGFWLSLSKIFAAIITLGTAVAFANLLPKNTYGIYQFILSVAAIISVFSLTGMPKAVARSVARDKDGSYYEAIKTTLRWSPVICFIALGGAAYYFLNENNTLAISLLIVGTFLPIQLSFRYYTPFLQGKKDFKKITFIGILSDLFLALTLIFTLYLTNDPLILIGVYFVMKSFTALIFSYFVKKNYQPDPKSVEPEMVSFGKHLSFMNVLGKIANRLDSILLFTSLGATPLAIYAFSQAPITRIKTFDSVLHTLIFPKLSQRDIPALKKSLPKKLALLFAILLVITGLYILAAPFLYALLFPAYLESVIYSQILALTILFLPTNLLAQVLIAHMQKRQLYIIKTIGPTAKIILLLLLAPLFGIMGVVWATVLSGAFSAALQTYFFIKLK